MPRRRFPSWLPQALGYGLSAACLLWVLRHYDITRFGKEIQSLDWRWVSRDELPEYLPHNNWEFWTQFWPLEVHEARFRS